MSGILTDEQMLLIRYATDGPADDDEPNSLLPMLRMLVAHLDAVVKQHVEIIDTLKNVLRSDEEQLKLECARAQGQRDLYIAAALDAAKYLGRAEKAESQNVETLKKLNRYREVVGILRSGLIAVLESM